MEKTLILLKPDCVEKRSMGEVISRFEKAGFTLLASKILTLFPAVLREHYAHVADKPFYPEIEAFMSSKPVMALVLGGDGVIDRVRLLLGPTDSTQAAAGTIRGDMGQDKMRNMVHASDSAENAETEIKRFFQADELVS